MKDLAKKVHKMVKEHFIWKSDMEIHGVPEHWKSYADEVEQGQVFYDDCVWEEEEVYVKGGVKKVKDLKVGDLALSYDFETHTFVYKPVVYIWDKGLLPAKEVTLKNCFKINITHDHPLWVRTNQGFAHGKKVPSKYIKQPLSDVDLSR